MDLTTAVPSEGSAARGPEAAGDGARPTGRRPPPTSTLGVAVYMSDADLALAMQMEEVRAHRMEQRQIYQIWDPLWGEVSFSSGLVRRSCEHAAFTCCPCAIIGCKQHTRRVWRRFFLSWSFILGVLQIALLVVPILLHGGHVPLQSNPMLGPHYHVLDLFGAKNAARIRWNKEWWRLGSPIMLHAGWLHLLGNLAVQLRTGATLEVMWGHTAWLCIFFASGIFGVLASCCFTPNSLGVGSSGALCGLLGGWGSFILITWNQTSPVDVKLRNAQTFSIGVSVLVIVGFSFLPLMDFPAHVGGLLMGAAVAMAVFAGRLQTPQWRTCTRVLGVMWTTGLLAVALVWFLAITKPDKQLLNLCMPPDC